MDMDTRETSNRKKSRTYLPTPESRDEITELARFFEDLNRFLGEAGKASLKGPDGTERELPRELYEVLEQVAVALANGNGVTVAPYGMQLTTQEAADFLGISRPTLVKLLSAGEIAHEMRGRHRRVTLRDLVDYQDRFRVERRTALREMAKAGQPGGITQALPTNLERLEHKE